MTNAERRHAAAAEGSATAELEREPDGAVLVVRLAGTWRLGAPRPDARAFERELREHPVQRVAFVADGLVDWDTALVAWLRATLRTSADLGIEADRSRLPRGIAELLRLADLVAEPADRARERRPTLLGRIGARALGAGAGIVGALGFLGRLVLSVVRFLSLRAQFRPSDFRRQLQRAGADAVPIITLVSVIVGLILAFVGAVQLRLFGADLYVADLVAIAIVREMGAMVVAIVMAGRTGAAYAAQLATMNVTEETDALRTFGISAMDFLVLPRVVALFLMTPLLCLYANALGIAGGAFVGVWLLGISPQLYLDETIQAVTLSDLYGGLLHSAVYGLLIGIIGCYRGLASERNAGAVGAATTSAVVTALVAIVVADGVMAVIFDALGI